MVGGSSDQEHDRYYPASSLRTVSAERPHNREIRQNVQILSEQSRGRMSLNPGQILIGVAKLIQMHSHVVHQIQQQ